jgi:hypothetical protein
MLRIRTAPLSHDLHHGVVARVLVISSHVFVVQKLFLTVFTPT